LGRNLEHLGRSQEAIEHWKLAVEANPDHSEALCSLSQALDKSGDPDAERYTNRYQALEEKGSFKGRVEMLNNFALEARKAHDWPRALEQLKEALRVCGRCPALAILHKNLGLVLCREGDLELGMQELRLALKLNPDDADALSAVRALEELEKRPRNLQ
jgi:tetratricopeptide (TPR) repeat protein